MQVMYMRLNNRDTHSSLLRSSEDSIVVINKKLTIIEREPVLEQAVVLVKDSEEQVVLLWQKQIHDNHIKTRTMKGGDAQY